MFKHLQIGLIVDSHDLLFQSVNRRLSEQKLLRSGDVEQNPGPLEGGVRKVGTLFTQRY